MKKIPDKYFDLCLTDPPYGLGDRLCKGTGKHMPTLSSCEYAWTSFDKPAKMFSMRSTDLNRFHPTQKPTELMRFCLNYAKTNMEHKIFDPFMGSGTTAVVCKELGLKWAGCELDDTFFHKATERLKITQPDMFGV
jgi:DNA modification methylase